MTHVMEKDLGMICLLAVYLYFTCYLLLLYFQFTCYIPIVYLLFTSCLLAVHLLYTRYLLAVYCLPGVWGGVCLRVCVPAQSYRQGRCRSPPAAGH